MITNLALLIRALEQDANANILSTPTLLTLDNEEARIIVGQNIPFVTGQYATTGSTSTVTPFQTFERHDVGVMLRVKPQITEGGTIRLNIYQEVSRVESITTTTGHRAVDKRALESSVIVDDGQIVVLGGLIQDSQTTARTRCPWPATFRSSGSCSATTRARARRPTCWCSSSRPSCAPTRRAAR